MLRSSNKEEMVRSARKSHRNNIKITFRDKYRHKKGFLYLNFIPRTLRWKRKILDDLCDEHHLPFIYFLLFLPLSNILYARCTQ